MLACDNRRLTFTTDENEKLLDVAVEDLSLVRPSWVGYGSILVLRSGGKKYGFRMTDMAAEGPAQQEGDLIAQGLEQTGKTISAVTKARRLVRTWCEFLKGAK